MKIKIYNTHWNDNFGTKDGLYSKICHTLFNTELLKNKIKYSIFYKPCPLCGSKNIKEYYDEYSNNVTQIRCLNCDFYIHYNTINNDPEPSLYKIWQNRTFRWGNVRWSDKRLEKYFNERENDKNNKN